MPCLGDTDLGEWRVSSPKLDFICTGVVQQSDNRTVSAVCRVKLAIMNVCRIIEWVVHSQLDLNPSPKKRFNRKISSQPSINASDIMPRS